MKNKETRKTDVRPGQETLTPCLSSLREWFQRSNLPLTEKQYKQLWQYHNLLREKNEAYDLTRILQFDNMVQKHYIDSIMVASLLDWKLPSPILDVGTGAGLPAIPLKIACPETEFILSEGRHKRVQFLNEVLETLNLQKIEIYAHKTSASFSRPVMGVITRAVESIPKTLLRVKKSLQRGGWAIFMKGPHCDEEIKEAIRTLGHCYRLHQDIAYTIPRTPYQRRLVIFERLEDKEKTEGGYRIQSIESQANATFKQMKALLTSKGIKKEGHALVFGQKIIQEVMRDFPGLCSGIILPPSKAVKTEAVETEAVKMETAPVLNIPDKKSLCPDFGLYRLSRDLYSELDIFGTDTNILMVKTPPIKTWQPEETGAGCTLMIPFQDPENTGAVIRTAVAFGVKNIVLLKEAVNPYHPKSIRAAGSAIFRVDYQRGPSIQDLAAREITVQEIPAQEVPAQEIAGREITDQEVPVREIADRETADREFPVQAMQRKGIPLITLSMEGADISQFKFPASFVLLPGVEGPGLPEDLRPHSLAIPIEPALESLNAATAVAIALYEWSKGKRERGDRKGH